MHISSIFRNDVNFNEKNPIHSKKFDFNNASYAVKHCLIVES